MRIAIACFLFFIPLAGICQDTTFIQNDDFISDAFGFPHQLAHFKKRYGHFLEVSKSPFQNVHDKAVTDTIYTLSVGRTKIEIYKARHREILYNAFVDTDKISFLYNIKVGISKIEVEKKFKPVIKSDVLVVSDSEELSSYTFVFVKDKLVSIFFDGYIE